jgi:hypothetical protein
MMECDNIGHRTGPAPTYDRYQPHNAESRAHPGSFQAETGCVLQRCEVTLPGQRWWCGSNSSSSQIILIHHGPR